MYGPMRSPGLMFGISQNQIKSFLAKSLGLNNIIISASSTEGALAKFDVPVRSVSADISVSWNGSPALFWANWLLFSRPVLPAHDWRTQDAKLVRTLLELHVASAIAYMQRQMRDDGTFMPFDIEFQYDVGYEGDSAVVLGWLDIFLNAIASAVSGLDRAVEVVAL